MRGLKETAPDGTEPRTDRNGKSMTESAQWGQFSENFSETQDWGKIYVEYTVGVV